MDDGLAARIDAAFEEWFAQRVKEGKEIGRPEPDWMMKEACRRAFIAGAAVEREPTALIEIGAWLLPEGYGEKYDHFTQTKAGTIPGQSIALFARKSDIEDRSLLANSQRAEREPTDTTPSDEEIKRATDAIYNDADASGTAFALPRRVAARNSKEDA